MLVAACGLHIALSVGKMTSMSHSRNILPSLGIHWQSNGFNGNSIFFSFTEIKVKGKL